MRKLIQVILGVVIGALGYHFYNANLDSDKTELKTAAIIKPKGVITVAEAKVLDANWTNTRKAVVDSVAGKPDNRSSWYSLDDMRNYLDYAEHKADSMGYDMDGVRLYLGVYSDSEPKDKAGYTTMFIAPTGVKSLSKSSSSIINTTVSSKDIQGLDPLNDGTDGIPPSANYPQ